MSQLDSNNNVDAPAHILFLLKHPLQFCSGYSLSWIFLYKKTAFIVVVCVCTNFHFKLTASYGQLLMVHPLIQGTRKGKYTAAEKYGILVVVVEGWGLFTAKKTRAGNWESDRKTQCRFPPSFVLQHFFSVTIMSVRLECVCLLHIFLCVIKRTIDFGWTLA